MSDVGQARQRAASDFVRHGVLDRWGRVPDAQISAFEMGRPTAEWLLALAPLRPPAGSRSASYSADFELMEQAIREAGFWKPVREVVNPTNVHL